MSSTPQPSKHQALQASRLRVLLKILTPVRTPLPVLSHLPPFLIKRLTTLVLLRKRRIQQKRQSLSQSSCHPPLRNPPRRKESPKAKSWYWLPFHSLLRKTLRVKVPLKLQFLSTKGAAKGNPPLSKTKQGFSSILWSLSIRIFFLDLYFLFICIFCLCFSICISFPFQGLT